VLHLHRTAQQHVGRGALRAMDHRHSFGTRCERHPPRRWFV